MTLDELLHNPKALQHARRRAGRVNQLTIIEIIFEIFKKNPKVS